MIMITQQYLDDRLQQMQGVEMTATKLRRLELVRRLELEWWALYRQILGGRYTGKKLNSCSKQAKIVTD